MLKMAVQHVNRLKPKFLLVSGDLTNAWPCKENARVIAAQRASFQEALRELDPSIPLGHSRQSWMSYSATQQNAGHKVGHLAALQLGLRVLHRPAGSLRPRDLWAGAAAPAEMRHGETGEDPS